MSIKTVKQISMDSDKAKPSCSNWLKEILIARKPIFTKVDHFTFEELGNVIVSFEEKNFVCVTNFDKSGWKFESTDEMIKKFNDIFSLISSANIDGTFLKMEVKEKEKIQLSIQFVQNVMEPSWIFWKKNKIRLQIKNYEILVPEKWGEF